MDINWPEPPAPDITYDEATDVDHEGTALVYPHGGGELNDTFHVNLHCTTRMNVAVDHPGISAADLAALIMQDAVNQLAAVNMPTLIAKIKASGIAS